MGQAQSHGMSPGTTPPHPGDAPADKIRHDIDHTRAEMDETIDALSDRLQPRSLLAGAMEWVGMGSQHAAAATTGASFASGLAADLLNSFRNSAKDATMIAAKKAGHATWNTIREHPLPSALIGAGLIWLLMDDQAKKAYYRARIHRRSQEPDQYGGSYVDARTGEPYQTEAYGSDWREQQEGQRRSERQQGSAGESARSIGGYASGAAERAREAGASARESAADAAQRAREAAAQAGHRIGDVASQASHRLTETAAQARQRLGERASQARERVRGVTSSAGHYVSSGLHSATDRLSDASQKLTQGCAIGRERFQDALHEHPLSMSGAAFGMGLMLGLLIPESRYEDRTMGGYAEQTRRRARDVGQQAWRRGRHAAEATMQAVTEEARQQGLTPQGVADSARNFAQRVKEDAREEGLSGQSLKEKVGSVAQRAGETAREEAKEAGQEISEKIKPNP